MKLLFKSNLIFNSQRSSQSPDTPEINVIGLDFRRYSDDLKKDAQNIELNTFSSGLSQDVDSDVLSNLIGHYSKWSFQWTFLLCMFQLPTTFHLFMFVFQAAPKEFWCARPAHLLESPVSDWRNLSQTTDGCQLLNTNYSEISYENGLWTNWPVNSNLTSYIKCTQFEFSNVDGLAKSLIEEYNLVCDRKYLISAVEMSFLAGAAVGAVLSGWISDRFGRRHTLMIFATIQTAIGSILAFSTTLTMYMTLRVIIGFACMTVTVVSFVLVVELVSGKWRSIIGILNILPVAISYVLTALIAYFIRDWRMVQLVISVPWFILLFMWYWLPESPRWLLAQGRLEELSMLLERAAKTNGSTLPSNYQKMMEAALPTAPSIQKSEGNNEIDSNVIVAKSNPFMVVFDRKYWRTTVLTLVIWFTLIIIYFGLTLHLSNLGGNIYINTAVAGSMEAISICISILVVLKAGIRRSLIAYMLLSGLCCLATNILPEGKHNLNGVIALAVIAKCLIGANNAIIPTYTSMQYPTVIRNFGVGMGNMAAGIALILVPYLWLLEHYDSLLPLSVMGVCGLVGAVAVILMKETN